MGDILFLVLRRLRAPLIALILIYAISIAGLVAIPGMDAQGQPWRMSYFHAFYIISYTATTIGFGEIPFPFTDAQRIWITAVIYVSVTGWAYALGTVFNLSRDPAFRAAAARSLFVQRVRRLREPYCVVCGYGRSGREVTEALDRLGVRVVLLEVDPQRVALVEVQPFSRLPIVLVADARRPESLRDAGIAKPECRAVIALTDDDETNQIIAIGARVLDPVTRVMARISDARIQDSLAEFGGVQVIDPIHRFAQVLQASMISPIALQVEQTLSAAPGSPRPTSSSLPRGHWVLAGDARFIQPALKAVLATGQTASASPGEVGEDDLRRAGLDRAVGLVAAASSDADNVGMVSMARRIRPELAVVIRQNKAFNQPLIETARADRVFRQSAVITPEVLSSLTTPLLARFLDLVRDLPADEVQRIAALIESVSGDRSPWIWTCELDPAGATLRMLKRQAKSGLRLSELQCDPREPTRSLPMAPLAVLRASDGPGAAQGAAQGAVPGVVSDAVPSAGAGAGKSRPADPGGPARAGRVAGPHERAAAGGLASESALALRLAPLGRLIRAPLQVRARTGLTALGRTGTLSDEGLPAAQTMRWLPSLDLELAPGDQVLFAGAQDLQFLQRRVLTDPTVIEHLRSGAEPPRSAVFRWWAGRPRH